MPKVSVITPAYNCVSTILDAFNSVVLQTFLDWEWIVIDDDSTDDSFAFIKELTKSEKRVVLLKTQKNGGSAVARNIGLKNAKGKYITFLDSDDILDPDYLEKQVAFIEKNGPIISSGYRRMGEHTTTDFFVPNEVDYNLLLRGNPLSCLTTMYDRETIGDVFFPEDLKKCEDYVFWLEILKKGYVAKSNPKVLATYRIGKNTKSSKKLKLIKYMFRVYHNTQKINWFTSWCYVIRWAFYGIKKYKNVR